MTPRKYEMSRRRLTIDATRSRILAAARSLIGGSKDLDDFTIDSVAEKAGVSRMTVFNQFKSRAGLLDALADHLAARGGMVRPRDAFTTTDPGKAIDAFVRTFVHFWASDRITMRRLRAMGVVFPSQAGKPRARDQWRSEHLAVLLERFQLPTGARKRDREDVLSTLTWLTAFETFDSLCTARRTPAQVASLLSRLAREQVGLEPQSRRIG